MPARRGPRTVARWEITETAGAVVVIDVIRAFSTAAYAFGAGAEAIYLVDRVEDALAFKTAHPGTLAMGEDHGRRPDGFDFPNSPAMVARADLDGRVLVQRTSAGTRGVVAARRATHLWAASLVCASATAAAVEAAGVGEPTYVITGLFEDRPEREASDDRLTAEVIERARLGLPIDSETVAAALLATDEALLTRRLGPEHCDPADIEMASRVDAFAFAMEVGRTELGLRLERRP